MQLESSQKFTSGEFKVTGRVDAAYGQMIQGLLDVPEVTTKVTCMWNDSTRGKKSLSNILIPCELHLTIYAHLELFDEVGRWLQDFDTYLQDPRVCHMDVKYCNPHKLSFINVQSCPTVSEVIKVEPALMLQAISESPNLLDETLSNPIHLEEAPQPRAIKSTLKRSVSFLHQFGAIVLHLMLTSMARHQKEALSFMTCREQGWGRHHTILDIWDQVDTKSGRV